MNNNKEDNYGLNEHFQYYSPKTNEDDTIDPKSFKIIKTISKHKDSIFSLNLLNDNRIASISIDSTIRIFNPSNNYKCEKVIKHDRVSSLCQLNDGTIVSDKGWIDKMYLIDKDRVVFGHDDIFTIINVGKCIVEEEVEDAMMGYVTCFTKLNDKYIICGCCGGLCLYNMEDRTYKIIEYGHCMPPCDIIKIDEHTFATCEENIKIWTYE